MESATTTHTSYVEKARRLDYTGMNFGVLVRLSFEPKKERENYRANPTSGVEMNNRLEQIRIATEKIEARGGKVTFVYDEPHTSAWKKKPIPQADGTVKWLVDRPVFEGAIRDLKKGFDPNGLPIHALAVPFDHRLTRDMRHLQDAKEVVEYHDRPIIDLSGLLDLLTPEGRENADYQVKANAMYSRTVSTQGKISHAARARAGIPVGGVRPFGFMPDKRTHKKDEVKLLRDTVRWLLDEALNMTTIEQKWYDAGFRTSKGGRIVKKTIKNILLNPRIAGIRTYRQPGKPLWEHYLLDANGKPVKGQWNAIIPWGRWQELVDLLTNEDRPFAGLHLGKVKYVYSPVLRCGECGGRISGQAKENSRFDYACKNSGCHKVAGSGNAIDDLLTPIVIRVLSERSVTVKSAPWPKLAELLELEAEKDALIQQAKEFPKQAAYIWPIVGEKDEKIRELRKEQAAHNRKHKKTTTTNVAERWDDLELEQQHALAAEVFEVVILHRARRASNRFDPERLEIIYRQE
ncbi:recombinase family protein [Streptomyces sp. CSDS2]|uniref:recombinase family protein n=1 Tax=Streptomyces sp. CSDS2 TaxID=3055051 RepID=UPI0025B14CE3|nr:recombinase family protein [Streptomyces sp. CSDS2]MDN3263316.1 recombinase family protein [Streptomyces sp. CSDS2]